MRSLFTIILSLPFFYSYSQAKKRALFIGNSYTYVNNLPQLVKDIALSKSDTLVFDQSVIGGATFNTHYNNPATYSLIQSQAWDVVVIQGQSQEPSLAPAAVMAYSYPYARMLSDSVRKYRPCCEVMFFMTWGRKNSDTENCPTYTPSCSYAGMQARLRESYLLFADSFDAACAPVGVAWKSMRAQYPAIELYDPDESHPGINGSYIAASVFYSSIFQKAVNGATFYATLQPTLAIAIHQIATSTVMDSIPKWNLNSTFPAAGFNYQFVSSNTVQFTNTSLNAKNFNWSFGSGIKDPVHTFSYSPPYVVTLTVSNTCTNAVITKTLNATSLNENSACELKLFLSEENELRFNSCESSPFTFAEVFDLQGRVLIRSVNSNSLPLSRLPEGIYLLHLKQKDKEWFRKVIQ